MQIRAEQSPGRKELIQSPGSSWPRPRPQLLQTLGPGLQTLREHSSGSVPTGASGSRSQDPGWPEVDRGPRRLQLWLRTGPCRCGSVSSRWRRWPSHPFSQGARVEAPRAPGCGERQGDPWAPRHHSRVACDPNACPGPGKAVWLFCACPQSGTHRHTLFSPGAVWRLVLIRYSKTQRRRCGEVHCSHGSLPRRAPRGSPGVRRGQRE